jgi:hypothetical protein
MKIIHQYLRLFLLAYLVSHLLISCAKQGSLSGGPKDTTPPRLLVELSDSNYLTNHYPSLINLYFDEWIQLKNQSQILISPPLEFNPKIKSKGKRVEIELDEREVLRDSTTYSINFGSSIVDFTESNPVKDFLYVFATGDVIDSLEITGSVIDSYTKKPVDKVTVMLYDQDRDSIVYEEKPYYFATTDKTGSFKIRNMRDGSFKCFALLDADFNFLYNQENEKIAFSDTLIVIKAPDSLHFQQPIRLELFLPDASPVIIEKSIPYKGKLKLVSNTKVEDFSLDTFSFNKYEMEIIEDSIMIWYEADTIGKDSLHFVYSLSGISDTLVVKSKSNTKSVGPLYYASFKEGKKKLLPEEKLSVEFNQPITSFDTAFVQLSRRPERLAQDQDSLDIRAADTLAQPIPFQLQMDSINHRKLYILADWNNEKLYDLELFPGAVKGYFENSNDTLATEISFEQQENLGSIFCRFDSLNQEKQYVIVLKMKQTIIQEDIVMDVLSTEIQYNYLKPGKYILEIIEDENRNGRWDPGNYLLKKQSEKVREVGLEELRKNWDLETDIKWDNQ